MIKTTLASLSIIATLIPGLSSSPELNPALTATSPSVQEQVEEALEAKPGGIQTAWNEVTWDDGEVILTIAPTASEQVLSGNIDALALIRNCPNGRHCVFNGPAFTGSRLSIATCSSQSTSQLSRVRSIANARSSGTVRAYNGSSLVTSVAAGRGTNVTQNVTRVSC